MKYRASFLALAVMQLIATTWCASASAADNQVIELRTYTLQDAAGEEKLDQYLETALLPALERQGLGPFGVFDQATEPEDGAVKVLLLIAGPTVEAVTGASAKLAKDETYRAAAADYLSVPANAPLLQRIRSELLYSFDCWPKVTVSEQKKAGKDRLFEMRVYESPTENFGELKVEMFNAGEVPIFLDCKIAPVFMGHALIGDQMPNLTYMTVYDGDDARQAAWKNFSKHPDWQVLKEVEKYKGTVSKIYKSDWKPKSYSQL